MFGSVLGARRHHAAIMKNIEKDVDIAVFEDECYSCHKCSAKWGYNKLP